MVITHTTTWILTVQRPLLISQEVGSRGGGAQPRQGVKDLTVSVSPGPQTPALHVPDVSLLQHT